MGNKKTPSTKNAGSTDQTHQEDSMFVGRARTGMFLVKPQVETDRWNSY